jgi:hypothetical protein
MMVYWELTALTAREERKQIYGLFTAIYSGYEFSLAFLKQVFKD